MYTAVSTALDPHPRYCDIYKRFTRNAITRIQPYPAMSTVSESVVYNLLGNLCNELYRGPSALHVMSCAASQAAARGSHPNNGPAH